MHWHTYGNLKAHQESATLRVSTAGIILFKNCAIGEYSSIACKLEQRLGGRWLEVNPKHSSWSPNFSQWYNH